MDTKTVTLELDAFHKIERARRPTESFSEVIRRGNWPKVAMTGRELLAHLHARGPLFTEEELDSIDRAESRDLPPSNPWI